MLEPGGIELPKFHWLSVDMIKLLICGALAVFFMSYSSTLIGIWIKVLLNSIIRRDFCSKVAQASL